MQRHALIEMLEPEVEENNEGDLSSQEDLDVETGLQVDAGTGEGNLAYKFTLLNQVDIDDPSKQILVIEDNTFSAYALSSIFEQYQIQFQHANNGHEAI